MEPVLHIKSRQELKKAYEKYHCSDLRTLGDVLWYDFGVSLLVSEEVQQYENSMVNENE